MKFSNVSSLRGRASSPKTPIKAAMGGMLALILMGFVLVRSFETQSYTITNYSANKASSTGIFRHLLQDGGDDAECRDVRLQNSTKAKCDFVKRTEDCENDDGFFDYNDFVYCKLGKVVPLAMVILVIWWLFCFIGLAVTADDYFCPSLVVISKTLRLSPNVAGVTFLAFGNGAPDLFSAIASFGNMKGGDSGLGVGGLLGAGMFVTTVVVGTIAVIKSFKATERPFLRDVIFYMGLVYWTFFILWKERVYMGEAIGFICLYVLYVVIVIASGAIYKKQAEKGKSPTTGVEFKGYRLSTADDKFQRNESFADNLDSAPQQKQQQQHENLGYENELDNPTTDFQLFPDSGDDRHRKISYMPSNGTSHNTNPNNPGLENTTIQEEGDEQQQQQEEEMSEVEPFVEPPSPFMLFLHGLNPINTEDWSDMRFYAKFYEIFKAPIVFLINCNTPVVDYEIEDTHNWNRYLQVFQTFSAPTFIVVLIQQYNEKLAGKVPSYAVSLAVGLLLAAIIFFTSKNYEKPKYHAMFGYFGFIMSIVWIYVIANEIVNLLETFGIVLNISNAILGLTLLAWGNSVGDWIANTIMARQGFARMGFSACFGAPFFNLSLGFAIPLLINMIKDKVNSKPLVLKAPQIVLSAFLLGSLVSSLIFLPLRRFKANKIYGAYLVVLYIVFLVVAILVETDVIPSKNFKKPNW